MKGSELKAEMDSRFDRVDARFQQVDARFDRVDARLDNIDARLDQMDVRFEGIDARLDSMDGRITEEAVTTRRHFDVVAEELKSQISALAESIATSNARAEQRLRPVESERVTLLSALRDHELRLRVLEGARRSS